MPVRRSILWSIMVLFLQGCSLEERGLALKRVLAKPARIGMIAPSSRTLYHCMVGQVLQAVTSPEELIVELGPGTGVGTQVLLEHGVPAHQILCIELDPELQKYMTEKFPEVQTILGDATNLKTLLGDKFGQIAAIISGIPLKNLSREQEIVIVSACHAALKLQGKLTQFTYGVRPTSVVPGFARSFGGFVFCNLPPAFVWTLTKTT